MNLVLNDIDAENVREETFRGREYLVAPVVPIQAMNLDGGYVPEREIHRSVPAWNGTPVTLNHPRNEHGDLVSANAPSVAEKTWLGYLFNTDATDGGMEGEIWLDVENAQDLGGEAEAVLESFQNGEPVSVSTSYFGDRLEPGEYDGEQRENVMGNLRPDHLAVLPNKDGRCSIDDGCVAGPQAVANDADVDPAALRVAAQTDDPDETGEDLAGNKSVAGVTFTGTSDGKLDESAIDEDDFEDHYLYPGDSKSDSSYPVVDADGNLRKGNVVSAWELGARGGVDEETHKRKVLKLGREFDSPPDFVEQAENAFSRAYNLLKDALSISPEGGADAGERQTANESAESDTSDDIMTDREEMVDVLTNEHGFKQESLEGMGDTCLERTYNSFVEDDDHDDEPETNSNDDTDESGADDGDAEVAQAVNELREEIESLREEAVTEDEIDEAVQANEREQRRQDLIDDIVANSDEYDQEALSETPLGVVENIHSNVTDTSGDAFYGAQPGASPDAENEEVSDFPALSVSEAQEADN